jgi:hypothetical protein
LLAVPSAFASWLETKKSTCIEGTILASKAIISKMACNDHLVPKLSLIIVGVNVSF